MNFKIDTNVTTFVYYIWFNVDNICNRTRRLRLYGRIYQRQKNRVIDMNNIFVVTENFATEHWITKTTIMQHYILKAFGTKRKAFEFIEQLYYDIVNPIYERNGYSISNVYIGNNVVRTRGFYKLFGGKSTKQFLYEYRIEEIPFE